MNWIDAALNTAIESDASPQSLRKSFKQLLENPRFNWLVPIICQTLDEYIQEAFTPVNSPNEPFEPHDGELRVPLKIVEDRYSPYQLDDNISVANDLINRLLKMRSELLALEAQAIETALWYCQEVRAIEYDAVLNKIALEADLAVLQRKLTDADITTLEGQITTRREALSAKLNQHNKSGSPLNFGEQVEFMRGIYADNIRILAERFTAITTYIKLHLPLNTPVLEPRPTHPKFLDKAVPWIREIIQEYEEMELTLRREIIYIDVFATAFRNMTAEEQNAQWMQFLMSGRIDFELHELPYSDMRAVAVNKSELIDAPQHFVWLVGLSAAMCTTNLDVPVPTDDPEKDRKKNMFFDGAVSYTRALAYPITITPPLQKAGPGLVDIHLGPVPLRLDENVANDLQPKDPGLAYRFYPFGSWSVKVDPSIPHRFRFKIPELKDTLGNCILILAIEVEIAT